ncbi:MAG: 50S ribosomal protein L33 [Elusimicrobiota bacterium]
MREWLFLECPGCSNRNYRTNRSGIVNTPKLELKKYCRFCRKHTTHKEKKK